VDEKLEAELLAWGYGRTVPKMRTTARLGADDHGQPLFRSTQSYSKLWLNPWIECREQRLHGTDAYGRLARKTQGDDPISVTSAHDQGLVLSSG
jgi:hypothetical protein